MKPRWRNYFLYASMIIAVGGLLYILIETIRIKNTGFGTKTLWDWMELLIIPLVLALGAFYLNRSERAVERQTAEDRAKLERELATDRQREAALQSYLDRMADLLLEKELRETGQPEVKNVARIRTLTVLRGLDARRKGLVLLFLREAGLISNERLVVKLNGADLTGVILENTDMSRVYMEHVDLRGAFLRAVNLENSILMHADLRGANLTLANLSNTTLLHVNLEGAILNFASLADAKLEWTSLRNGSLQSSILAGASLTGVSLEGANLHDAQVGDALDEYVILRDTIMPDGTKHE